MNYKILIRNNKYTEWEWFFRDGSKIIQSDKHIDVSLNPFNKKLFTEDIVDESYNIIESKIRNIPYLSGILLIIGKTYGRTKNGKGKFIYKCIPNNKLLPAFLIPYEQKIIGFQKNLTNKFILFKFNNWDDKHPIGTITQMIGDISSLQNFYEYQLYCKNLNLSIKQFTSDTNSIIKYHNFDSIIQNMFFKYNIQNRQDHDIISIDPIGCADIDDAIGLHDNIISIYISNVPLIIEYLNLWDSFSQRISTIYLPDRKRSMLPTSLSENLCSLLQRESRIAFCIDIHLDLSDMSNPIKHVEFCNALINVRKNYIYDDHLLLNDKLYSNILKISQNLCNKYKYLKEINDSHDVIAFFMILMNHECAKKLIEYKNGIFRCLKLNSNNLTRITSSHTNPASLGPDNVVNFIKIWQSSGGLYTTYENKSNHDLIGEGLEYYAHITSPIRRLVDLLNIMKIQHNLELIPLSPNATLFYSSWINDLDYINNSMRSIRKIQIDCSLLHLCTNDKTILNEIYDGYVFDKIERENKYFQYSIYLPKLKMISRSKINLNLAEFSHLKFKIFLIEDGLTLKRKIRVVASQGELHSFA